MYFCSCGAVIGIEFQNAGSQRTLVSNHHAFHLPQTSARTGLPLKWAQLRHRFSESIQPLACTLRSFSWLNNDPLHGYSTSCLAWCPRMNVWVIATLKARRTFRHKPLSSQSIFSSLGCIPAGLIAGSRALSLMGMPCFEF